MKVQMQFRACGVGCGGRDRSYKTRSAVTPPLTLTLTALIDANEVGLCEGSFPCGLVTSANALIGNKVFRRHS